MSRRWVRFCDDAGASFGLIEGDEIAVHTGDMFAGARPTGQRVRLGEVTLLAPCVPSKMIGLWRNFPALADALKMEAPATPLYFLKANSSFSGHGAVIRQPQGYDGPVVFEGELAIVIGRAATRVSEEEAASHVFGYTCLNDVTALELLHDEVFPHWTRAKGFDSFAPFRPCIATGLDWSALRVRTVFNGTERQNYAVADMLINPAQLVSRLSHDMTLLPGDVIACGTSVGVGRLKPGGRVEVSIDGIGTLANTYEA